MELKQVEAFLAVAAHGSFSRAAGALHLTQPSVTSRIQSLERDLGQRLFQRNGRGVTLTDVGQSYLPYAQRMVQNVRDGREAVQSMRRLDLGTLRLAAAPSVSAYVLPELLAAYHSQNPALGISIRTVDESRAIQMVLADDVDVAIHSASAHPDCVTLPLYDEETILVCARDDEFAKREDVDVAEIAERGLIQVDAGLRLTASIADARRKSAASGRPVRPVIELSGPEGIEAAKEMVKLGVGIAALPVVAVRRELERGELHQLDVEGLRLPRKSVALIYQRGKVLSSAAQAFVALLEERYGISVSD